MTLAYFDCPSGAAGDMIMGALVDAGLDLRRLSAELGKLPLDGYHLESRQVMKAGFRATKVDVHVHDHAHPRGEGGHGHAPGQEHGDAGHPQRRLAEILDLIGRSALDPAVKAQAARVFTRLGEAEARAHGTTPSEVHFHDVGAVDAIVDVVGACAGLHLLGVGAVHVSALPIGGGFVRGPHGRMPVPGPATAELLRGFPVVDTGIRRELVTPTGAAILTTLGAGAGAMPPMTVTSVGYGAGDMDLGETPNVLRLFLGEGATGAVEEILQVEATIDDMSPQLYEPVMERLFAAGALDVWLAPVTMKKSRPGVVLTALVPPDRLDAATRALFEESTTIGVRWARYQRHRLDREMVTLETQPRAARLQGVPARGARDHDHARVRRRAPPRPGARHARARGAGARAGRRPGAARRGATGVRLCAACRHENPASAKFCAECGARLAPACPACAAEVPPSARFCPSCGGRLEPGADRPAAARPSGVPVPAGAPTAEPAARPAAYTPRHLAEKILQVALGARGRAASGHRALRRHRRLHGARRAPRSRGRAPDRRPLLRADHGRGAPLRGHDQPVHRRRGDGAVRRAHRPRGRAAAGRARRARHPARARATTAELEGERGLTVRMRIGLNTGPVVVGRIGDDLRMDYTAVGDTTNLAARMQQMRAAGQRAGQRARRTGWSPGYFETARPRRARGEGARARSARSRSCARAAARLPSATSRPSAG